VFRTALRADRRAGASAPLTAGWRAACDAYRLPLVCPACTWRQLQVNHNEVIHEDLLRFNRLWLTEFAADSLLVFSTGRSPELFRELGVSEHLAGCSPPSNYRAPQEAGQ
jgi:hypothetical protein